MVRLRQSRLVVAGLALGVFLAASGGRTAVAADDNYWIDAGIGMGSMLANVAYMPAKLLYAGLGALTGGLTYALTGGSYETAENVWIASLGGSYVLTPEMLRGQIPIEFSGTPTMGSLIDEPTSLAQGSGPEIGDYAVDSPY